MVGWAANVGSRGEVMFAELLSSSFYQAMASMKKAVKVVKVVKAMKGKRTNYVQRESKKRRVAGKAMEAVKRMKVVKSKKPDGDSLLQTFCLHCFTMVERIRCRAGEYFFSDYYCQECGGGPLVIVAPDFYD